MAYGLLNPLDDGTEWLFMNGANPNPAVSAHRTYAQVLADVNNAGYDTVMIRPSYNNYYQSLQYYSLVMFNLGTRESFRVANAEYLTMTYENGIAIDSVIGNLSSSQYKVADYRNDSLNVQTPGYTLFMALSSSATKDNINYRGFEGEDNNCITLPCVILSTADVGTWYLNNSPIVQYQWASVPAISGKNGILSLSRIKDDYINNGEAVTNAGSETVTLTEQSNMLNIGGGIPAGQATIIQYSGSVDYIEITPGVTLLGIQQAQVDFYMAGSVFYSTSMQIKNPANYGYYLSFLIDEDNQVAKISPIYQTQANPNLYSYNIEVMTETEMQNMYLFLHSHIVTPGNDDDLDNDGGGGDGDGTQWHPSTISGINNKPTISAIDTGFTTMYVVTASELRDLASFLWSSSFVDNVKKFFSDPREVIIGLSMCAFKPPIAGSKTDISAGGINTGIQGYKLTKQYDVIHIGSLKIKQQYKNKYLDYPPFSKITIHLPYVGDHSLDVNEVSGKTISVDYIVDFLTGACVAQVSVNSKPHYFFAGNCIVQIPTSSEDFGRQYSSVLSAGATIGSVIATMATGGLTAPLLMGNAASMAANGMNLSPDVVHTSGGGSTSGWIAPQDCYITVEYPNAKKAAKQYNFTGIPSYRHFTLNDLSGYTKCLDVHLDGLTCTYDEREQIRQILTKGFRIESHENVMPDLTPSAVGNFVMVLMKCKSDPDVLGKEWVNATKVEGKLLFGQDITAPVVTFEGDYKDYNYCYIPTFGRYYYIGKPKIETGTLVTLPMQVDVLESFKTGILASKAVVERQEHANKSNALFNDTMMWTQQNKEVLPVYIENDDTGAGAKIARGDNCYILTIAGGA